MHLRIQLEVGQVSEPNAATQQFKTIATKAIDDLLSFDPVFATYAIAASLMILKAVAMSWLTVLRMMQVKGGYRSPEDLRQTLLNPSQ